MKQLLLLASVFFTSTIGAYGQIMNLPHCGYDFTSYLVLNVHEEGNKKMIEGLRVTLVDSLGNDVVNVNNTLSWTQRNQVLRLTPNYKIDSANKRVPFDTPGAKWFFPFAEQSYLLSVSTSFKAEIYQLKIEDIDGADNGGDFETAYVQLYPFNMYVLCSSENERAKQFGLRSNRPIIVGLRKKSN